MRTREEVVTAMKTSMTDGTIGHGAPGMITLRIIIGMMTEPPLPKKRLKLNLKLRSMPKEDGPSASTSQSSQAASVFGRAKPVDTAARERKVEERQQKEQKFKLPAPGEKPKLAKRRNSGKKTVEDRKAESEKSLENETLNKEDCHSLTSKLYRPLKLMPAPGAPFSRNVVT
ncbi:hypothetical protein A6R68_20546, partial [Neotoma lepida]